MHKSILVNARHQEECRIAILKNKRLDFYFSESAEQESIRGHIYKAIVTRIEPSLGAAFVELGPDKSGFISIEDVSPNQFARAPRGQGKPRIQDVMVRGQEILVQVTKDVVGTKKPALTTYISLPGRYLVLMPGSDSGGISRRITDEESRKRLKEIVADLNPPADIGLIVRTAGFDRGKRELTTDFNFLIRLWKLILKLSNKAKAPALINREPGVAIRTLRDYYTSDTDEVLIDSPNIYEEACDFFQAFMPRSQRTLKPYKDTTPLFSAYNVEEQVAQLYQPRVELPSGGGLVIEPTEALVSIDVNSGKATREKGREETAYRTNCEAAEEIARELRLRDLGGLVVIDFIDMMDRKHNRDVERRVKAALKEDKARIRVGRISPFGLLELSRQRIRKEAWSRNYLICPTCMGQRIVPSSDFLAMEILRNMQLETAKGDVAEIHAVVNEDTAFYLLNAKRDDIVRMEEDFNLKILITGQREGGELGLTFKRRKKEALPPAAPEKEATEAANPKSTPKKRRRRRPRRSAAAPKNILEASKNLPEAPSKPEVPKKTAEAPGKPEVPKKTAEAPGKPEVLRSIPAAPGKPEVLRSIPAAPKNNLEGQD